MRVNVTPIGRFDAAQLIQIWIRVTHWDFISERLEIYKLMLFLCVVCLHACFNVDVTFMLKWGHDRRSATNPITELDNFETNAR